METKDTDPRHRQPDETIHGRNAGILDGRQAGCDKAPVQMERTGGRHRMPDFKTLGLSRSELVEHLRKFGVDYGDPSKPPPPVECHLGHEQLAVWSGDAWTYPNKEECPKCIKQDIVARDFDNWIKRVEDAGVPAVHQVWSTNASNSTNRMRLYHDNHNRRVVRFVKNWRPPRWVALCGPVGVGKTSWASALFMDYLERNRKDRGVWTTEMGIFREAEAQALTDGHPGRIRHIQRLIAVPALMIDDLGASGRKPSEFQLASMRDIIDERHSRQRVTFFTTNYNSFKDLEQLYGAHIISRLQQAVGNFIRLDGPDRRLF